MDVMHHLEILAKKSTEDLVFYQLGCRDIVKFKNEIVTI